MSRRTRSTALLAAAGLVATVLAATAPSGSAQAGPAAVAERVAPAPAAAAAPKADPPQLRRKGRWLVDQHGRVVILHGVNLVWKHDPYVPPATPEGFTARDARWLRRHGFNGARIGTLWAGITPDAPGRADPTYRQRWQRVMDLLAQRGIWMQLDQHMDMWHETYGGEGVPDWAMIRPAPFNLLPPVNAPFPMGYWTPEVSTVYDEFWANKHGLIDGWAAAWEIAARWWQRQPYLMGYDLINEPWMGLEWPSCFLDGCQASYVNELQPAYEKVTAAIRRIDPHNVIWWESQQFSAARPVPTYLKPMKGEKRLGYSWHNYCTDVFLESQGLPVGNVENCQDFNRQRNQHALDQAKEINGVAMMSEWGATDNVRALELDASAADEHLMGWMHWAYKRWNDPTTADTAQGLFTDDADLTSVKADKLRVLVRTYAQATAGKPLKMSFDPATGDFEYRYRAKKRIKAPTVIFVSPLHYPSGYRVQVDGGKWSKGKAGRIKVRATKPGATVTVRIQGR